MALINKGTLHAVWYLFLKCLVVLCKDGIVIIAFT